jgi:nucleotide-binding universal stress UspA family protein
MYQIVVGVDGSPASDLALTWAINAARARGGSVTALHAWQQLATYDVYGFGMVDLEMLEDGARVTLEEIVARADTTGLPADVERALVPGSAAGALLDVSRHVDLVVVGSRGRGEFAGLLLGSVSHQVVAHSACPAVVVPGSWTPDAKHRVVVGVDGSDGSRAALSWALEWARGTHAEVEAVLAFDPGLAWIDAGSNYEQAWVEHATAKAEADMREILGSVPGGNTLRSAVVEGAPARVLLDHATDADLLVVGTRGRGGFGGLLMGSVSQRCIEHTPCPVAVVPGSE